MKALDKVNDVLNIFLKEKKRFQHLSNYIIYVSKLRPQVISAFRLLSNQSKTLSEEQFLNQYRLSNELKALSYNQLSNLLSKLYVSFEHFLLLERMQSDSLLNRKLDIQPIIDKLGLNEHYKKNQQEIEKRMQSVSYSEIDTFKLFYNEKFNLVSNKIYDFKIRDNSLNRSIDFLNKLFFTEITRFYCETLNRNYFQNENNCTDQINLIINSIPQELLSNPLIYSFTTIITMFENDFQDIETIFPKRIEELKPFLINNHILFEEKVTIAHWLLNICLAGIRKEFLYFCNTYIELIDLMLELNLLLERGYISHKLFKTCISVSLLSRNQKWGISFFQKFKHFLKEGETTDSLLAFCSGLLDFNNDIINVVNKYTISLNDIQHELGLRKLCLKIMIKSNEWSEVPYLIFDINRFVKTKEKDLPIEHKNSIKSFTKYINLINPNKKRKKESVIHLHQDIQFDNWINDNDKKWLIDLIKK